MVSLVLASCCAEACSSGTSPSDGGQTLVCAADASTEDLGSLPPPCPPGYWLNSGVACGPFGAACRPSGDGLCYRLCGTNDDCTDPCAPSCSRIDYYAGGDTPSGAVPVCLPGTPSSYPAECVAPLRTCWAACQEQGPTSACAEGCREEAQECAATVCEPERIRCIDGCHAASPDPDVINACVAGCWEAESSCRGPW